MTPKQHAIFDTLKAVAARRNQKKEELYHTQQALVSLYDRLDKAMDNPETTEQERSEVMATARDLVG